MGMFDSVWAPCPTCSEQVEFQSKGGNCLLEWYDLANAPYDVMSNVNRHAPVTCRKCGTKLEIDVERREVLVLP